MNPQSDPSLSVPVKGAIADSFTRSGGVSGTEAVVATIPGT
jgi:hypothetical protein